MAHPAKKPQGRFTYDDYCTWPEDERWELIDGVAHAMSPAPGRVHGEISGDLFVLLKNFLADKPCRAYHAPFDVRLPRGTEPDD